MATPFSFTLLPPPDALSLSSWLIFAGMTTIALRLREQKAPNANDNLLIVLSLFATPAVLFLIEDADIFLALTASFLLTALYIMTASSISSLEYSVEEAPDGKLSPDKRRLDGFMGQVILMLIFGALIYWSLDSSHRIARVVAHGLLLFSCVSTLLLNISLLSRHTSGEASHEHQGLRLAYLYTACYSYLLSAMLVPNADVSVQTTANLGDSLFIVTACSWALNVLRKLKKPAPSPRQDHPQSGIPDTSIKKPLVLVPLAISLTAFLLASIILHAKHPTPAPQLPVVAEPSQKLAAAHTPPKVTNVPQHASATRPQYTPPVSAQAPQTHTRHDPLPPENPATAGLPKEWADEYLRLLSAIGKYKRDKTNTRFIDSGDISGSIHASQLTLDQEDFSLTPLQRFEALLRTARHDTRLESLQKQPDGTYRVSLLVAPVWGWGSPYYVDYLLDQILHTGRRAHALRIPLGRIHVKAVAQDEDAYGFTHTHDAIQLTLTRNHIRKINWLGIGNQQMANLLQVKAKRYGKRAMIAWCLKDQNLTEGRKFCNSISHDTDSRQYLKNRMREEARESGEEPEAADWSEAFQTPARIHSSGKNAARSLKSAKRLSRPSRSSAKVSKSVTKSVTRKTRSR